ncbi:hypothetical protein [Virgibacillus ihumii]|uniref:hypothetical protein n=1 Tax=Virgibacillus ihumii TaxID=2686091 RepID=UPI00157D0810|nr:hypothetical protein [Virgibacillus ihumii]
MKKGIAIAVLILISTFVFSFMDWNGSASTQAVNNDTFEDKIKNFGKKLTNKLPKSYSMEDAIENGDIVVQNGISSKEREKIDQFIENVKNDKPDFIRFP